MKHLIQALLGGETFSVYRIAEGDEENRIKRDILRKIRQSKGRAVFDALIDTARDPNSNHQ